MRSAAAFRPPSLRRVRTVGLRSRGGWPSCKIGQRSSISFAPSPWPRLRKRLRYFKASLSCALLFSSILSRRRDDLLRGIGHAGGGLHHRQFAFGRGEDLAGFLDVGPFQSYHHGDLETDFAAGFHEGVGDQVAFG